MAIDVRLDGLAVGYRRGREVASDISVIFRGGELSCLIGPNGTGKSTLLKTISGFLEPKSGSVWFDDGERKTALSAMSHRDLARKPWAVLLTPVSGAVCWLMTGKWFVRAFPPSAYCRSLTV